MSIQKTLIFMRKIHCTAKLIWIMIELTTGRWLAANRFGGEAAEKGALKSSFFTTRKRTCLHDELGFV